jgi:protein-S-isoprenylcysteine O-methyltransferase Ste14
MVSSRLRRSAARRAHCTDTAERLPDRNGGLTHSPAIATISPVTPTRRKHYMQRDASNTATNFQPAPPAGLPKGCLPGMESSFANRGGWWVLAQTMLMLAVIVFGPVFPGNWLWFWRLVPGLVLITAGGWFGIAGVRVLGQNRTPFPRPRPNSQLIRHGIYARVRHPLYTSVMLVSLGWALAWGSWPALLTALAMVPFFRAKARIEERWLRATFQDYSKYENRVPPFLPRVGKRQPG